MKKNFKFYAVIWAIVFAAFNAVVFAITGNNFTGMFWVGYGFITVAFIGQLLCAYLAFKPEKLSKIFLNIPLVSISYIGLIVSLIFGVLCMVVNVIPVWVGIVVCYLVLVFTSIALLKANAAAEIVSGVEEKVKTKTAFIKMLTADAEHIMTTSKSPEIKAEAKKVYEAIRYSDPMSVDELSNIENQIKGELIAFENAVNSDDVELATQISSQIINLVDKRNNQCKALK